MARSFLEGVRLHDEDGHNGLISSGATFIDTPLQTYDYPIWDGNIR